MTYVSSGTLNSAHSLAYGSRNSNNIEHFEGLVILRNNKQEHSKRAELRESQIVEKMSCCNVKKSCKKILDLLI